MNKLKAKVSNTVLDSAINAKFLAFDKPSRRMQLLLSCMVPLQLLQSPESQSSQLSTLLSTTLIEASTNDGMLSSTGVLYQLSSNSSETREGL
jgi:hypothetical protein